MKENDDLCTELLWQELVDHEMGELENRKMHLTAVLVLIFTFGTITVDVTDLITR